jgi:hypothetical protein
VRLKEGWYGLPDSDSERLKPFFLRVFLMIFFFFGREL